MEVLNCLFKDTTCVAKINRENDLYKGKNSKFPSFCAAVEVDYDDRRHRFVRAIQDIPSGKVICVDEGITCTFSDYRCQFCVGFLNVKEKNYCARCRVDKRAKMIRQAEDGITEELRRHGMLEFAVRIILSYPAEEVVAAVKNENDSVDWHRGFSSRSFLSVSSLEKGDLDMPEIRTVFAGPIARLLGNLKKHAEWAHIPDRDNVFCEAMQFVMLRIPANAHSIYHPNADPVIAGHYDSVLSDVLEDILWPPPGTDARAQPRNNPKANANADKITAGVLGPIAACSAASATGGYGRGWSLKPGVPIAVGFFPSASLINHSCAPNTYSYFHENRLIFVSRGIRKGEEITDSYGPTVYTHSFSERQSLLKGRGFTCNCTECYFDSESQNKDFNRSRRRDVKVVENEPIVEKLLTDLRDCPPFLNASRILQQLEKYLPCYDLSLAHAYRITAVAAAQEGRLPECLSILDRFSSAYSVRQLGVDPVTASNAHAIAILHFAEYQRTGIDAAAQQSQIYALKALSQYTLIYGKHGLLTRSLVRFIKERQMLYL